MPNRRGSTRWKAPELLALLVKPKGVDRVTFIRPTKRSDIYSLAMVVIEVTFPVSLKSQSLTLWSIFRYLQGESHFISILKSR